MALFETLPLSLRLSPLDWPHSHCFPCLEFWELLACWGLFFPVPQLGLYSFK